MISQRRFVVSPRPVTRRVPTSCCSTLMSRQCFRTLGQLTKPCAHSPDLPPQLPNIEVENERHNIALEPSTLAKHERRGSARALGRQ